MVDSTGDQFDRCLRKALDVLLAGWGSKVSLTEEQMTSIGQLWIGGDLLAVLPTGLIFHLLVFSKDVGCALVICLSYCCWQVDTNRFSRWALSSWRGRQSLPCL